MNWLYLAAISAFFYGLYNVLIKLSSGSIHQMVGAVALQIVAALLGIAALIILKLLGHPLTASKQGFLLSACAGLAVGVAEILTFYLFSKGVSASVGIPVIVGGTVVAGSALGVLVLGERLGLVQGLGVLLVIAGIACLVRA